MPNPGRRRLISTTAASLALAAFSAPVLAQDWTAPLATPLYVGTETQAPVAVAAPAPLYSGADTQLVAQPVAQIGVAAQIQPVAAPVYDYGLTEAQAVATPAPTFVAPAAAPQIVSTNPVPGAPVFMESQDEVLTATDPILLDVIVLSAEEQIKQALGVSTITAEDIARHPVLNDISQIIRRQPGVNLTGSTATGQRGNNRQIDLRGMGPENTLILIDGKPVLSRNSVRMGRQGERDSRGDSNWVAPELVERIEVLRGPAAARYGSGSSGGVVNIITKRPSEFSGSVNTYFQVPQDSDEGGGQRVNAMLAGPIAENLSFRLTGNYNKTDADSPTLNLDALAADERTARPAGREGVVNKDIGALLSWEPVAGHELDLEGSFSRQGNIYTGESENSNAGDGTLSDELASAGAETNVMKRTALSLTHFGAYDFGSSFSYIQWENTKNTRNPEGTAGSGTGLINSTEQRTSELDNITAKTEWVLPLELMGINQSLTLGGEFRGEYLDDQNTNAIKYDQQTFAAYVEDNISLMDNRLILTPALRYDHSSSFGGKVSPSLNATYDVTSEWKAKVGVAQAFKAPNLYQLSPDYLWLTMGNGCPYLDDGSRLPGPCYIKGNPDLEAETSLNKEIGLAYEGQNGLSGSVTYFHNDYKNRIAPTRDAISSSPTEGSVLLWQNTPEAVVSGLEGNVYTPLGEQFALNVNATYMLKSEDKRSGQPLSLVPKYTVNASLDWTPREDLSFSLSATHYGDIEGPTFNDQSGTAYTPRVRPSYTLFGVSGSWDINENVRLTAGVENLLNKQLYRTGQSGDPNSYNEPGRAFYLSLGATF